jgi:hypothetical protein
MADDDIRRPTHGQPLNGPRRPTFGPLVITVVLLAVIGVIFLTFMSMTPDPAKDDPHPADGPDAAGSAVTARR